MHSLGKFRRDHRLGHPVCLCCRDRETRVCRCARFPFDLLLCHGRAEPFEVFRPDDKQRVRAVRNGVAGLSAFHGGDLKGNPRIDKALQDRFENVNGILSALVDVDAGMTACQTGNRHRHRQIAVRRFHVHLVTVDVDIDAARRRDRHRIRGLGVDVDKILQVCDHAGIQIRDARHQALFIHGQDHAQRPVRRKPLDHAHDDRTADAVVPAEGGPVGRHGDVVIVHHHRDGVVRGVIVRDVADADHVHMRLQPHHGPVLIALRRRNVKNHVQHLVLHRMQPLLFGPLLEEGTDLFLMAARPRHLGQRHEILDDMQGNLQLLVCQLPGCGLRPGSLGHKDASLRRAVVLRDDAAEVLLDILHEKLIVGQPRHAEDIRLLEHGIAVAARQQVRAARKAVLGLRVEGLAPDHDIRNLVFPVHRDELASVVPDDMALPRVHAERDARDLREGARNDRQPRHAELQRIQQHLPGDPDRDHIAGVGQDVQDVVVRDRAGFQVVAHGTGIDQRRLRAAPGPEGIRHQLAQPVFLDAADVKAVCIPDDHVTGHLADLPLHDRGVRGDDLVQEGLHLRVHTALGIVPGDGLEGEVRRRGHAVDQGLLHAAVLVDLDLPDGSKIHARLGHGDLPALPVGDGMAEGLMGMAVDDQIQPGQPSNDRIGTKLLRDRVVAAEVRNEDHIVRPGLTHLIDGLLQPRAQPVSRLVGQKVVHRLAGLVQNVTDDGFGKGIRRDRADKADLQITGLQNAPGLKHRLAARDAEIGAGIAAGQFLGAAVQHLDPVVELMVARHSEVVAEAVHHFDDLGALGDGPDGRALDGVASIDQQHVVIDLLELFLIQCQAVVADVVLKRHMHVVGVQDHRGDLIGIPGHPGITFRSVCESEGGKQTAARQQTGKEQGCYCPFHTFTPPSNRSVRLGCRC